MTPVKWPVAESPDDVLEQAAGRRVARPELGERVALQRGDAAGEQEREPDGRAGDLAGRAEQREDAGADHGADADERGLPDADETPGRRRRPGLASCRVRRSRSRWFPPGIMPTKSTTVRRWFG